MAKRETDQSLNKTNHKSDTNHGKELMHVTAHDRNCLEDETADIGYACTHPPCTHTSISVSL